ncbi:MAG: phosphotransferase [Acidimicrobiales bacterium]
MLTATDLLTPDADLPSRDLHLDPWSAAVRFGRLLGDPPAGVIPRGLVRSKYRIGESLRVVHRFEIDGRTVTATARLFRDGNALAAFEKSARVSPEGTVLHDPECDAVWWMFPTDRRMRRAAEVMHPSTDLAFDVGLPGWAHSEVAEYAPERSLTVRAADDRSSTLAFVKLYAPDTVDSSVFADRYRRVADWFADGHDDVSTPRVLGRSSDGALLALSPLPGWSWRSVSSGQLDRVLHGLGAAIAHLHHLPISADDRPFGRLQIERVVHSAELVGRARPETSSRLEAVAERWASRARPGGEQVLLHGDCHPNNTLVDDGRLSLIDLDQAGVGSPAADIASFLARLSHGVVLGDMRTDRADQLADAFLAGYAEVRRLPDDDDLRWHRVAALIAERSIRAVNRVDTRALEHLDALVDLIVAEGDQLR